MLTLCVLRDSPDSQVTGDSRRAEEEECEEGTMVVPGTMVTCVGKGHPSVHTLRMIWLVP